MLDVSDLSFAYNYNPVLDGIDLTLSPGTLLAILGPNGAGKTTLLKCINAIHRPSRGSICIDGKDILSLSPTAVARKVGYVAQQNDSSRMMAFDAVLMGRRPHVKWGVSEHDLKVVDAALKRLGLKGLSMRYLDEMSGGERQKIAIDRALVQEPRLLLLDEPTSSLDLKNQVEILETIRRVVAFHEVAVIMTMHDLNTALRFADQCIFLKKGQIFYAGPISGVDAGMVETVYDLPVAIVNHGGRMMVTPQ